MLKIVLPLFGIVAILGFITWLSPIKQQDASTTIWSTSTGKPVSSTTDTCGDITVSNMTDGGNPSYGSQISLKSNSATQGYTITYLYQSYWCGPNNSLGDGVNATACISNEKGGTPISVYVPPSSSANSTVTLSSPTQSSTNYGYSNFCGVYQTDFSYVINGTSCRFGYSADDTNPNHPVYAASYVNTNTTCATPNPSPSVSPSPSPSTSPSPSPSASPSPSPSASPSPSVTVTVPVSPSPTSTNTNNCDNTTQSADDGSNNNNNCNQNTNTNNNNNNNTQSQSQTQNNNQSVNITLNSQQPQQQQQQQQQVLAAATGPTELPKTGAESDILFGLLALIPVGWKIRKLV